MTIERTWQTLERMRKIEERNLFTREQAIALIEGHRDRHVLFCERHFGNAALAAPVVEKCNRDIGVIQRGGMISITSYAWQNAKIIDDLPDPGDEVGCIKCGWTGDEWQAGTCGGDGWTGKPCPHCSAVKVAA